MKLFIKRVVSMIIDVYLTGILSFLIVYTISKSTFLKNFYEMNNPFGLLIMQLIFSLLIVLYFTLLEYFLGATIGKLILRIRIIDKNNQKLKYYILLLRFVFLLCLTIIFFINAIYYFFKREFLQDSLTRTIVCNKKDIVL